MSVAILTPAPVLRPSDGSTSVERRPQLAESRWAPPLPALLALMYPALVAALRESAGWLQTAGRLSAVLAAAAVVASVALICAVPAISLAIGHALGHLDHPSARQRRGRWVAHLAFASASMFVAVGNFAGLFRLRAWIVPVWLLIWAAVIASLFIARDRAADRPAVPLKPWLRTTHGASAAVILAMFLLPHLSNHVMAIWSGATHLRTMAALRTVYRERILEPVLLGLVVFQIASGLALFLSRVRMRSVSLFDTLQTMSGVYLGVFFTSHLTAVFSARSAHVDTNWNWLVNNGSGLLTNTSSVALLPHYLFGPLLVFVHLACALRIIFLAHAAPGERVDRLAIGLMALGGAVAVVAVAALLGTHLAP